MPTWRILIVDDEPDVRSIIRATLSQKYEVVEAQDGLDALQKLELAEPDFIVLDVMMPLMDGFQTCEAIRKHPRFKNLSVLFLSALNTREDMKRGYGAGGNLFLTKPFDPSRLLRNIDLFFETNPPGYSRKRYTLAELQELQTKTPEAIAEAEAQLGEVILAPPPSDTIAESQPQSASPTPRANVVQIAPEAQVPPPPRSGSNVTPTSQRQLETPRPRLLVVDDDSEIAVIVRATLENDFEVLYASNGIEAIEKITSYQPDLLMLDAMMPKMSGYQLCQSLRRNPRFTLTPILFASGKASPRDQDYAMRIGANAFLPKPFAPKELRDQIQKLVALPTFRLYPKSLTFEQLNGMESERRKRLEEQQDRLQRREETELQRFLRENK